MKTLNFFLTYVALVIATAASAFGQAAPTTTPATPAATASASPNNCAVSSPTPFRWVKMGGMPLGPALKDLSALKGFIVPADDKKFSKPWQAAAKEKWDWDDDAFNQLNLAVEQEQVQQVEVRPCTLFDGMMWGSRQEGVLTIKGATLADWNDKQSKKAWVWKASDEEEVYFFVDCSNVAYREVVVQQTPPSAPAPRPFEGPPRTLQPQAFQPAPTPAPQLICNATQQAPCPPPAPVAAAPAAPSTVHVVVEQKVPWHQTLYNLTGSGFHVIAGAWAIKNWNFRKDGLNGTNGTNGTNGRDGLNGNCLVVGADGKVTSVDCSKIGWSPPIRP